MGVLVVVVAAVGRAFGAQLGRGRWCCVVGRGRWSCVNGRGCRILTHTVVAMVLEQEALLCVSSKKESSQSRRTAKRHAEYPMHQKKLTSATKFVRVQAPACQIKAPYKLTFAFQVLEGALGCFDVLHFLKILHSNFDLPVKITSRKNPQ